LGFYRPEVFAPPPFLPFAFCTLPFALLLPCSCLALDKKWEAAARAENEKEKAKGKVQKAKDKN